MTFWTALGIALSGMALTVVAVWAVPILVVLEGEIRGAQRRGTLSAGLLMGLLGIHVSFERNGVRMRLLLFRRPSFTLRGRAGRPEAPPEGERVRKEDQTGPRKTAATSRVRSPRSEVQPGTQDIETGRVSRVPSSESKPVTPDPGPVAQGRPRTRDAGRPPGPQETPGKPEADEGPARAGWMERFRTVRGYFRRFGGPAMRFLRALRKAFRLRRVTCDLVFGTGDPATTGQISGIVYAVRPLLGRRMRIDISPNFLVRTFEAKGALAISVSLARITLAVARLAVTVGGMLGWQYVKRRWAGWRGRRQQAVRYSV